MSLRRESGCSVRVGVLDGGQDEVDHRFAGRKENTVSPELQVRSFVNRAFFMTSFMDDF